MFDHSTQTTPGALDEHARVHRPVLRGRRDPDPRVPDRVAARRDRPASWDETGAGKTSLLNVIAGDEPPLAGRAVVRGGSATSARAARTGEPVRTQRSRMCWRHPGSRDGRAAREIPPRDGERRASRMLPRFTGSGAVSRGRGYSGEAEVRRIAAGLGLPDDRLDLPVRALSGGSAAASSSARSCSRVRTSCCR